MSTTEGNKKLGWVVALMAAAVVVLGFLLYQRSNENQDLEAEKQALTLELADMKADLMAQMGENDSLNTYIQFETLRLSGIIDSINALNVENTKQLTAYRGRVNSMKKQNEELVAKLNAANEAYAALKLKEQMVSDSLNVALDANENLEGENSGLRTTVAKGKQLVVASSTISAVRVASNGTERKTRRAKRSDRLNVCITLAENRIADQGDVVLYTKWIAPNGKAVDAPETNMAILANERSNFNGSTAVDYDGSAVEVCIATDRSTTSPVELEPGIYTVAIMTESYVVGTVAVELK